MRSRAIHTPCPAIPGSGFRLPLCTSPIDCSVPLGQKLSAHLAVKLTPLAAHELLMSNGLTLGGLRELNRPPIVVRTARPPHRHFNSQDAGPQMPIYGDPSTRLNETAGPCSGVHLHCGAFKACSLLGLDRIDIKTAIAYVLSRMPASQPPLIASPLLNETSRR
jgi:hypothetical protein